MDVHIQNEGTVVLFRPLTQAANDWIKENIPGDPQWFRGALVVEARYAGDLAIGMVEAGLTAWSSDARSSTPRGVRMLEAN